MSSPIALLSRTPATWAQRSVSHLPAFLADHAVCELQASVYALSLVGMYPGNHTLVDTLSALAAEEIRHFRKVSKEARRHGAPLATKRRNFYVKALRDACRMQKEPERGVDLLLVAALIEARSHERFEVLLGFLEEPRLVRLYEELVRAEARHGPAYLDLAREHAGAATADARLEELLVVEAGALTGGPGREVTVHASV